MCEIIFVVKKGKSGEKLMCDNDRNNKEGREKYYITTAIAYTSKKPHIGNTYEAIFADSIARFKRMQGYDVFFMTGTDEHGQKIQEIAESEGMTPKQYVDKIAGEIKRIWDLVETSYDKFIRTTDDYHEETIKKIFKKLYDQGDIYKGYYEGYYCTPCESFFTETQLKEGKCPDCGREITKAKEEAYFFKLSKYADRLKKHIQDNPEFVTPESRKKEIINNFITPGLQDLCVSRTSFDWGIPVEFDPKHVTYVWIDALSNYITGIGYRMGDNKPNYEKYWPADVHIIGKDILRFHMIYWPIMLMALGQPLPKHIYAHGWMLIGEDKMSKSKGNVIYADDLVKYFGVDATRFYSLSEMPYAQDGNITYENFISKYNSELANTLGNLVNRTIAMVNKYFEGNVQNKREYQEEIDNSLINTVLDSSKTYIKKMDELRVQEAIGEIWNIVRRCNKYIDETIPWSIAKDESKQDRLNKVLYNLIESIRIISVLLTPIIPTTGENISKQLNLSENEKKLSSLNEFGIYSDKKVTDSPIPLFNRIDEKKKLEEIYGAKKEVESVEEKDEKTVEDRVNIITIDELDKVELKVGQIKDVQKVEGADKLYKLQVDLGEPELRTIVSGLVKYYTIDELINKKIVVVSNLKPVKLRGILSNGMLLAAGDDAVVRLLTVDGDIEVGSNIH